MVSEITITDYLVKNKTLPLIDVRSPGEFEKAHIPGAYSVPLFSDEERAHIGTVYVQESREKAIALGYTYVEPKLQWYIDESRRIAGNGIVAVHCWRGGMRSRAFAEHLDKNGFGQVYIISGGYKSFRRHVLAFFDQAFNLRILGGYTGSGKTYILKEMQKQGQQTVDLEGIARHKGSAFGGIGEKKQATVEQFENDLFNAMQYLDLNKPVWVEDESHAIGKVKIPISFYRQMREQTVYFIDIPNGKRAHYLTAEYAGFGKEPLAYGINGIAKRLGGLNVKLAHENLLKNNYYEVALIALSYYDRAYQKGMEDRDPSKVVKIPINEIHFEKNAKDILQKVENYERSKADAI